jgi:hypothetical protein
MSYFSEPQKITELYEQLTIGGRAGSIGEGVWWHGVRVEVDVLECVGVTNVECCSRMRKVSEK